VLTEKDGYFYGRAPVTTKPKPLLARKFNPIQEGRLRPDRDLIVALTADEEGGGPSTVVDWLIKNHRDLIDAEFCLNEGGWAKPSPANTSPTICRSAKNTS